MNYDYTQREVINAFEREAGTFKQAVTHRLVANQDRLESSLIYIDEITSEQRITELIRSVLNDFVLELASRPDLIPMDSWCEERDANGIVIILRCGVRKTEEEAAA